MSSNIDNTATGGSDRLTALAALHQEMGGKFVSFAGYSLPLHYPAGIKAEHLHTRSKASIFDVSHMGQIEIYGESVCSALECLVTGDISGLRPGQQRYTLMTNDSGGIIDDLMVTRTSTGLKLVVNAAQKEKVFAYLEEKLSGHELVRQESRSLLAFQGPRAAQILGAITPAVADLDFMQGELFQLEGLDCFVNRCGYTGEDGFEISIDNNDVDTLTRLLLDNGDVALAGLGARDTLRLEAGFCLYGHDIDASSTPVEANLSWTIATKYKAGETRANFPGAGTIMAQLLNGVDRKLVGLRVMGKVPLREGVNILDLQGETQGCVTSGGFAPSISSPVALGYVKSGYCTPGTELQVEIRKRFHTIQVQETPFIEHRYHNR